MSVINSFTQHTINLTRKALRLGSDFVHPVHDDTPDEPDYLSNADVPVEANIALPHSDDWDDGHLTVTDIDPVTGLLTTSTEGNPPLDEGTSIYDLYADRAERMGDEPLYTYKSGNDWVTVTANEFLADVRAVAKGLIHYGLKKGDAVAFMCRTSYDWDLTDAAIMACGGVLATIYDTDSAEQIRNIVNNSDARLLIVQLAGCDRRAGEGDGTDENAQTRGDEHHDGWGFGGGQDVVQCHERGGACAHGVEHGDQLRHIGHLHLLGGNHARHGTDQDADDRHHHGDNVHVGGPWRTAR